jgi:HPt (histidine-containing phosphotransfer) domain-containing protein
MDDYLGKPIRVEELVAALSRCQALDRRESVPSPILDPAAIDNLREMTGGDAGFVAELINTFLQDAPRLLAEMRQAVEHGDAVVLRRTAHSLKSHSAQFGALHFSNLCRELEGVGKAGTVEGAAERVTQAEKMYEAVRVALETARRDLT